MSKFIVVSVHRDRWCNPKLSIVVEARVSSAAAGQRFITERVMTAFAKRMRGKKGRFNSIRVNDLRLVDEVGLKRLRAAAKASATLRRKRGAKKAAVTRAKNRAAMEYGSTRRKGPKSYYPAVTDYAVN